MDLKTLPKVELHCHLEGCFSLETAREVGRTLHLDVPADADAFRRDWLITEPMNSLETALKKFDNIQAIWSSPELIQRLTFEACEYAKQQGIKILELRYSPNFIAGGSQELDFETVHRCILAGLEQANDLELAVGLIGIVQKTLSTKEAEYTTDFIIENKDTIVGIDLADQDIGFEVRRFAPMLEKARASGLRVTTHSGEEKVPGAAQHVRLAIEELGAERIGHGIHIIEDPQVIEFVKQQRVLLEVCPTSNWLTNAVPSTAVHPIRRLMDLGVRVSINSDDPGLFDIDLCHEYELLRAEHDFDEDAFNYCNDLAAAHSFLPIGARQAVWPRPIPGIS